MPSRAWVDFGFVALVWYRDARGEAMVTQDEWILRSKALAERMLKDPNLPEEVREQLRRILALHNLYPYHLPNEDRDA